MLNCKEFNEVLDLIPQHYKPLIKSERSSFQWSIWKWVSDFTLATIYFMSNITANIKVVVMLCPDASLILLSCKVLMELCLAWRGVGKISDWHPGYLPSLGQLLVKLSQPTLHILVLKLTMNKKYSSGQSSHETSNLHFIISIGQLVRCSNKSWYMGPIWTLRHSIKENHNSLTEDPILGEMRTMVKRDCSTLGVDAIAPPTSNVTSVKFSHNLNSM